MYVLDPRPRRVGLFRFWGDMTTTSKPKPTLEQYEAFERERQEDFFHKVIGVIGCPEDAILKQLYSAWDASQAKAETFEAIFGVTPNKAAMVLYSDGEW